MEEKQRESERLKMNLDIRYTTEEKEISLTKSEDINMGGLRITTRKPLKDGAILDLEIYFPYDRSNPLKAKGHVVWQEKITNLEYDTGIKLEIPNVDDEGRLRSFILHQQGSIHGVLW